MPESLSELAQKYRDEMLRMYQTRPPKPDCPSPKPEPPRPAPPPRPEPPRPAPPPRPELPRPAPPPSFPRNSEIIPTNAQPEIPPPILEIEPDPVIKTEIAEELPEIQENPESRESSEILEMNPEPHTESDIDSNLNSNSEMALSSEPELEEPVLPDYIQPAVPSLPDEWTAQEAYEKHNSAEGMLYVVASTADSAYPVPNARVIISSEIDGKSNLNYILRTDESGITPTVTLPAPPASLSQTPGNAKPYAVYDIRIQAAGYFREEAKEVPVFAGITSRQVFPMIPLPLAVSEDAETLQIPSQDVDVNTNN